MKEVSFTPEMKEILLVQQKIQRKEITPEMKVPQGQLCPQRCLGYQCQVQFRFCDVYLSPGAHLRLGFLQSAEIQPCGVSVLVFLRGLRVLWHLCAFADENFTTCWKVYNLSQDQENQCLQVSRPVIVPQEEEHLSEVRGWETPTTPRRS